MIISIDIGTSYSSVCMQNAKGEAEPVETSTGISLYGSKYSLPSAVFVEDNGEVLVGQAAMNSRKKKPQNFRSEFKRDLGQNIPIVLGGRSFLPEELYTELFRHMKECAEKSGNDTVEKAYITHPASFGKARCDKVRQAAKNAGLFDVELLDEPTAAAMCYGAKGSMKDGDILLVYDFGGGTFDVSLLRYEHGRYEPLTPALGIEHCGGIDIDRAVYADMRSKVDPETLQQLSANKTNRMRFEGQLAELAVKVKHHLSNAEQAEEAIPIGFDILDYSLSRGELERMAAEIVSQTVDCCKNILENSGMEIKDINGILLVGGTSRMPVVQEMVRRFAGSTPVYTNVDPDLAVAMGALEKRKGQEPSRKTDLGIEKIKDFESVDEKAEKLDEIKHMCRDFAKDNSNFQGNEKLYRTLGIQGQEVYLAHDDSCFQSGRNGFAITERGVYCCDIISSKTHVTFQELAEADDICIRGSELYADDTRIAYLTGADSEREVLQSLFEKISKSLVVIASSKVAKLEKVKQICFDFAKGSADYQGNEKLYRTLGIQGQRVYLAHDVFGYQRGGSGFAITERGVYCCDIISSKTHVTFQELAEADNICIRGSELYADDTRIAYLIGADSAREALKDLFKKIADVYW